MGDRKYPRLKPIDWKKERDLFIEALRLVKEKLNT